MRRTGQGGSVLGFILGGTVLAFVFIGGVYYVHQQSKVSRVAAPVEPTRQPPVKPPAPSPSDSKEEKKEAPAPSEAQRPLPAELPSQGTTTTSQELPVTGPRETLLAAFIVALLSWAATSYLRSRRRLASL